MAVKNADLLRLWDDAWDAAPEEANNFRPQLRIEEKKVSRLFDASGSLQNVGKNSANQTMASVSPGTLTQVDLARAWRGLIVAFDGIKRDLIAGGIAAPTDDEIYTEGLSEGVLFLYYIESLGPVSCGTDFSEARLCR